MNHSPFILAIEALVFIVLLVVVLKVLHVY